MKSLKTPHLLSNQDLIRAVDTLIRVYSKYDDDVFNEVAGIFQEMRNRYARLIDVLSNDAPTLPRQP